MGVSTFPASSGGGGASFKQITKRITSTQSFTVPADVTSVELILCGGGGAGGGTASEGCWWTGWGTTGCCGGGPDGYPRIQS